jgi:hypothetical protein
VPAAVTNITAYSAVYCFAVTAPSPSAVHFLPDLGRRNWAAPFYRQARRKLQVQA